MKFSAKGRYGIRAMIDLALHESADPISAKTIAERQDFSADYLEQIFRLLRKNGLVKSVRGPTGGFILARKPEEISIWNILMALEENFKLAPCIEAADKSCDQTVGCERKEYCAANLMWEKIGIKMKAILNETTLDNIVKEAREKLNTQPLHSHMFHI
ncbi:MAG: RrF2 family transcriptional regulator [Planctomycetota bacterium]|jgi:Rrf2 family protein